MTKVLAFDFGASSGRAILGEYAGDKVSITEIHRFSNDPVDVNGVLYWDILRLFHEIKQSIIKCVQLGHKDISSIGIDTWGVDFGLIDEDGYLMENPIHYRDRRTHLMEKEVSQLISDDKLYNKTGIQFMEFNTIYQLYSLKKNRPNVLNRAKVLLFIPDLLNYFLTGEINCEYTIASTSGMLNVKEKVWDKEILEQLGIPNSLFPEISFPGKKAGKLKKELAEELGIKEIDVILTASHDTASAVVSVPFTDNKNAFISSGTWSLLGKECEHPIVNEKAFEENYTNEGGYQNTIRFIKNISGLWLMQQVKKDWEKTGEKISFEDLNQIVEKTSSPECFIDPDYPAFLLQGDMEEKINQFLSGTKQNQLTSKGEIMRCILESLALTYKNKLEILEQITEKIESLHIVGGGAQNYHLCQFTADAIGKKVIAGPIEATAIGNIIVQLISNKRIKNLKEARKIISHSFDNKIYYSTESSKWNKKYDKYKKIIK